MTPAARIASVIELTDSLLSSWRSGQTLPADRLLDQYFKARRFIGSKDRGAIAELFYWILRHKASLEWWLERLHAHASGGRMLALSALLLKRDATPAQLAPLFSGGTYAAPPLTDGEWRFAHNLSAQAEKPEALAAMPRPARLNFPAWMEEMLAESLGGALEAEMEAMAAQAPVDLRANTLLTSRDALLTVLRAEGFEAEKSPISPVGIRLLRREAIFASPLFRQGYFEMQDEGSQVVALLTEAAPGMRVIDFCAGAGGKTLAVAAQMENRGRILAWDVSARRLAQLPARLKRAGAFNTEWRVIKDEHDAYIKRHKLSADRVLVDAPCSGSGTWRRNPDLKWRFTRKDLDEVTDAQQRILESAARLVKPGGRLIYATCSLLSCENEKQVERFLKTQSNFRVVCAEKIWNKVCDAATSLREPKAEGIRGEEQSGTELAKHTAPQESKPEAGGSKFLWLTPRQDGVDGFFAAVLERI